MASTRTFTALFALARLAAGAALVASPTRVASPWVGRDAERPSARILIRALGARDAALGGGTLLALDDSLGGQRWIAAAVLCDLADVAATAVAPGDALPRNARLGTVALGGASALAGLALLRAPRT